MKPTDWIAVRVSAQGLVIALLLLFLVGCAYNPYQQSHFDWTGAPGLVPLEERRPVDLGKMCLGDVA